MNLSIATDLFPLLAGILAALVCGLLGNFLVLRKLSLMGDAISHSVLPGLVIAFLLTASRNPLPMFIGATIAGVATALLTEAIKRFGKVDPGASMGVVFSILFALGVLLIEQAAARQIDLDADCVLHGQLETLVWYAAPDSINALFSTETLRDVPRQITTLSIALAAALAAILLLFKELRLAAFDPALATALGFNATALHYLLMILVAAATVASFEAVGSILVIAMLVCPAATARLLTDRLPAQLWVSAAAAVAAATLGYLASIAIPAALDKPAVNAAGSMTLAAGAILTAAILISPTHGVLARAIRRQRLARTVAKEDLLATLYRAQENGQHEVTTTLLKAVTGRSLAATIQDAQRQNLLTIHKGNAALTPQGTHAARQLVRKHRLWEHYLVGKAGIAPDHVHDTAERLEHTNIEPATAQSPATDPHGRHIPPPA